MSTSARTKLKTEDRQAALVQAALQLAAQRSPADITTGDLAEVIGITQGGVFKHFASKEAIWLAVTDWAHQSLMDELNRVAKAESTDPLQALKQVFLAHIQFVSTYPGVPRLIFQELQHAKPTPLKTKVQRLMGDYRELLMGLLMAAREARVISKEVDTQAAVVMLIGAVQGLVMQALIAGSFDGIHSKAESIFTIYDAGLRA